MLLNEVYQLPEKQWTPDINPVMATLTVVGQYTKDQYGFKQPIQLKDDAGVSSEVTVQTKFQDGLMTQNMVGTKARWRCKWYGSQRGNKIAGYCLDKIQAPSQPQQATPAAPQSTNAAPNSKDDLIKRLALLKAVLGAVEIPLDMVGDYLAASDIYATTGRWELTPNMARQEIGDRYDQQDSQDQPWES